MVVPSSGGAPNQPTKPDGVVKRQRHRPESSSMLDLWLQHHNNNLYPSKDEKEQLVKETELNYNQVSRWFANRRRKLKLRNCVSPSSSGGTELHCSSPSEVAEEVPGISPQAPNCPGNATLWNDGFNNTGGVNRNSVISSMDHSQQTILDSNNNNRDTANPSHTVTSNPSQLPLPHPSMTNQEQPHIQHLPSISDSNLFGGDGQTNQRQFFGAQDLLPTPPALIPGIYPSALSGRFPFSVPPFGVSSGLNLGANCGLLNPFFLSTLASANAGLTPNPQNSPATNNLWVNGANGFLPSLFSHPLLNPQEMGFSEKQKVIKEEEAERRTVEMEEETKREKDLETARILLDLSEKESIAVSVLAEFASQRKQQNEDSTSITAIA